MKKDRILLKVTIKESSDPELFSALTQAAYRERATRLRTLATIGLGASNESTYLKPNPIQSNSQSGSVAQPDNKNSRKAKIPGCFKNENALNLVRQMAKNFK
ncbi:MAG: hypothetical protein KF908_10375 [Nitrosomonas sp.]|uniref:Uncharacterized protein n=1 Tax=Nitrosomonas aestuarii TaxID=52441 RepID=A0A1I4CVJ3_9PROT|nr:hypothetical protein [Nitrosomonas aestuarii]MBX3630289.1 hypothetical protein [Nitrosomonas sp.]SFK85308.1 hypothetical protein SAMN05216302_101779 [Nitrosomonas aestuarii]